MFRKINNLGISVLMILLFAIVGQAQNTFNSGSTGADGAFSPTTNQTIVVPESGIFNYTTVNIPSNVTITYARNSKNQPVTILASGNVTIAGTIIIDGKVANSNGGGGQGGPGGFNGGPGGFGAETSFNGVTGDGPGGGTGAAATVNGVDVASGGGGGFSAAGGQGARENANVAFSAGGPRYGTFAVSPLIGGSGGGGGSAEANEAGGGGGGGGGAILIASSGTISLSGAIYARGGAGGSSPFGIQSGSGGGGGGAGGAIRLVSNVITGSGVMNVTGGAGQYGYNGSVFFYGGNGSAGYIRVETYDYNNFSPNANPAFVSFSMPLSVNSATAPNLRITSIAGISAPTNPLGSLQGVPDVIVPTAQTNPVEVALAASNIPVGTIIQVVVTPASGTRTTVQSSALTGTEASSTATASVTIPNGMSVLTASVVIDLTTSAANRNPFFINGERVDKIEIAATFGQESQVTYVTRSGKRVSKGDF